MRLVLRSVRGVKTLHTPIYNGLELKNRQDLLSQLRVLEKIIISSSYDKSLLYSGKYKKLPQLISGGDSVKLDYVLKEFLTSMQLMEAENPAIQKNPTAKLGKIGLQLFTDCHQENVTALGTTLSRALAERYNQLPQPSTLNGLEVALAKVRAFLKESRILVKNRDEIDVLVQKLCSHEQNAISIKKVLEKLDYKLVSNDVVRITRGRRTEDELEVSNGWKFPGGVIDSSEPYLRSLQIPKNKLVSVNSPMLVLVHDGDLRDANNVLPALHFAAKQGKSMVVIVNGEYKGDALAAITIHNNKNARQNVNSKAIVFKYSSRGHDGISLQENVDFLNFLQLPHGVASIYSPKFSEFVPSSASATQFFGSLESLKATTGEAFFYNPGTEMENRALRTTVTLHIGGESELEIDHRRAELDHVINNVLCHGLSQGWLPSQGISLVKAIKELEGVSKENPLYVGHQAVIETLTAPLENALRNKYSVHRFQAAAATSKTIEESDFKTAFLPDKCSAMEKGLLEPWSSVDQALRGVSGFLKLLSSCDVLVTRYFDKPRKD
ncbi:LAME_0F05028g1_1 [Lachancea meyersii CBS 8951]|uniref:LAME_0F05028g1_1 n=1 Tax=Lachancea meyersii CBS 8951 TaxID=1266667 RepID=A0A1G4JSD7_9SACH|nr:LAME_0F05028g1_1 [Lachancea meyersii CBS 8951]